MKADEGRFMDRTKTRFFIVDEYGASSASTVTVTVRPWTTGFGDIASFTVAACFLMLTTCAFLPTRLWKWTISAPVPRSAAYEAASRRTARTVPGESWNSSGLVWPV